MDSMLYLDQENGRLATPAIKSRQNRLLSAPDQCLRTPLTGKARLGAPLQSSRKALKVLNVIATPAASVKAEEKTKPAEVKCKMLAPSAGDELPEIEKSFPYNPSAFETYSVPDEVYLSRFSLAGLGKQMWPAASPVEELLLDPCLPLSPLKMPSAEEYADEMESFLQTINELTVDLPPECD